jgi:hypothetical protein
MQKAKAGIGGDVGACSVGSIEGASASSAYVGFG